MLYISGRKEFSIKDLENLYAATDVSPICIQSALLHSTFVLSAWDDDKLVGLLRALTDECTNAYIDIFIVDKTYINEEVDKKLVDICLSKLQNVPRVVTTLDILHNYDFTEYELNTLKCSLHKEEIL